MPWLLYCLFAGQAPPPPQTPPGVGGAEVGVLEHNGLGAALSWVGRRDSTPALADLKAYGKVVEAFHNQRTVIPLRYGCLCPDQKQVASLLEAGRDPCEPLLTELHGCVEMGIRALLPAGTLEERTASRPEAPPSRAQCAARAQASPRPGTAYLSTRLAGREAESGEDRLAGDWPAKCRAALAGLFVRSLCEGPAASRGTEQVGGLLLSMYFLVPRPRVPAFQRAFAEFSLQQDAKLMLSGPWPPYSFAAPPRG